MGRQAHQDPTPAIKAPVIRYHGGKFRLSSWILQHFPPHAVYVEPFGGAAGVLMQKQRSHGEVYNDLDGEIVNLFRVLQDRCSRQSLVELLITTPYARAEFDLAFQDAADPVERARRTIIRAEMGFGSAGATKGATGFRTDCFRKYSTAQQIWMRYPDRIAAIGARLSGVLIENRPAIEVMLAHDSPSTLHYVDPPYVMSTRVKGAQKGRYYRHELTDDDHRELLNVLTKLKGMVALSCYQTDLYTSHLKGWHNNTKSTSIAGGRGGASRVEQLWLNPACFNALGRLGLKLEGDSAY